jgi:hypothetical protein
MKNNKGFATIHILLVVFFAGGVIYAVVQRNVLKSFFETGDTPTADQFADTIDSSMNLQDDGISSDSKVYNPTKNYEPGESEVVIEDIAHALSNKCRFSGHSLRYFSVAEHSVIVSLLCPQDIALWGLLHDASEAYLIDLPTPLKYLPEFAWYRKLEEKVTNVIMNRFSLPQKEPKLVKTADKTCLVTEKRDNMRVTFEWENKYKEMPIPTKLNCLLTLTTCRNNTNYRV